MCAASDFILTPKITSATISTTPSTTSTTATPANAIFSPLSIEKCFLLDIPVSEITPTTSCIKQGDITLEFGIKDGLPEWMEESADFDLSSLLSDATQSQLAHHESASAISQSSSEKSSSPQAPPRSRQYKRKAAAEHSPDNSDSDAAFSSKQPALALSPSSTRSTTPVYGAPNYSEKRKKNNEAVKRCRERKRAVAQMTSADCKRLSAENEQLRDKLGSLSKEVDYLKSLLISAASATPEKAAAIKSFILSNKSL